MADETIRASARPLADAQAQARHLRACLRAGQLTLSQLQLAAALGDPAAVLAADHAAGAPIPPEAHDLGSWVRSLRGHGQEVLIRVGIAAARLGLLVWEVDRRGDDRQHRVLSLVEAWLLDPSEDAAHGAFRELLTANGVGLSSDWDPDSQQSDASPLEIELSAHMLFLEEETALRTGRALPSLPWEGRLHDTARAVEAVVVGICCDYQAHLLPLTIAHAAEAAAQGTEPSAVIRAIQREVVPWSLGGDDPLRERLGVSDKES